MSEAEVAFNVVGSHLKTGGSPPPSVKQSRELLKRLQIGTGTFKDVQEAKSKLTASQPPRIKSGQDHFDQDLTALATKLDELEVRLGLLNSQPTPRQSSSPSKPTIKPDIPRFLQAYIDTQSFPTSSYALPRSTVIPESPQSSSSSHIVYSTPTTSNSDVGPDELRMLQRYLDDIDNTTVDNKQKAYESPTSRSQNSKQKSSMLYFTSQGRATRSNKPSTRLTSSSSRTTEEEESVDSWLDRLEQRAKDLSKQRARTSSATSSSSYGRRRRAIDPVARYHEMQRVWAKDPFLSNGGDKKTSQRRAEGFREVFAALHAIKPKH